MRWLNTRLGSSLEHFRTYLRLRKYLVPKKEKDISRIFFLQFIGILLHTSSPFFWGKAVTNLHTLMFGQAAWWILASGALKFIVENLNYYRRVIRDRLMSKIRLYIAESFYEKYFGKSIGEHLREGTFLTAEYIRKGETNALAMEDHLIVEGYAILIEFTCVTLFLCLLVPFAGFSMLGIVAFNLLWNLYINHKVFTEFTPIEKQWRELGRFSDERLDKVVHIKNNAQEENTLRQYRDKFQQTFTADHAFWKWHFGSIYWRDIINLILWLSVVLYALYLASLSVMTVGTFLTMLLWTQSIMDKVWRMTELEARMAKLMAMVKISLDVLEKPPVLDEKIANIPVNGASTIEFRNVTFHYRDTLHTIQNFSLALKRGDRVAIVGPSGSGKTTLMSLLLRYFDPQGGEILIDGVPLQKISLKNWRRFVGLIPQQVDLLDGSIEENIAFGLPEGGTDRNHLLEIADVCQILEFGERLDRGIETTIGENGIQLSGGQRQRIAWATAIAKNPSVLIIDEGTSNLDALTEEQLVKNLNAFCEGKISFIIAHRLATLKSCNLFVVLRPAKDVKPGENQVEAVARTFDECQKTSPTFRAMLTQQKLQVLDT